MPAARTPKISRFYKWLKQMEGKEVNICANINGTEYTYDGPLLFVDTELVAVKERWRVHLFPLESVNEMSVPEANFKVKSKVKIKEIR